MKLRMSWNRVLAWTFVVLTAASGVNLVLVARNYFLFYSALDQVQFTIPAVSVKQGTSTSDILIQILAENPVDYSGLKVTLVTASTYFTSSNYTLFESAPVGNSLDIDQTIPPQGKALWSITIPLGSQDKSSLSTFYNAHYPNITASVILTVQMSTFLDKVVGLPTTLPTLQQNVTLT